jgi:hypothetical protein
MDYTRRLVPIDQSVMGWEADIGHEIDFDVAFGIEFYFQSDPWYRCR